MTKKKKHIKTQISHIWDQMEKMFSKGLDEVEANLLLLNNGMGELMNQGLTKEEAEEIIKESV